SNLLWKESTLSASRRKKKTPHREFSSGPPARLEAYSIVIHVLFFLLSKTPARCYEPGSTEPVSFYVSSLEGLRSWRPCGEDEDFNKAVTPIAGRRPLLSSDRPRTLVCHDMAGGYLSDRNFHHRVEGRGSDLRGFPAERGEVPAGGRQAGPDCSRLGL
uniref:Uncharacterized protein n=1 Tax=Callorhinchus milii TaxID=7868 RepID=A0A4W3JSV9_CALMI